jgi:hypothetical protein
MTVLTVVGKDRAATASSSRLSAIQDTGNGGGCQVKAVRKS